FLCVCLTLIVSLFFSFFVLFLFFSFIPFFFFFFNDTATTEIYTLSLHDALPILLRSRAALSSIAWRKYIDGQSMAAADAPSNPRDRKSTRLNSSHVEISYAVFCLKKKKKKTKKKK